LILDVGHAAVISSPHAGQAQQPNGDCYSTPPHWVTEAQLAEKGRLFVLADAFTGQEASESCRHAVNRLYQLYYSHPSSDIRRVLQQAIQRINNELYDEARRRQSSKSVMLLAAVLHRSGVHIADVGQVRAYLWHRGYIRQITTDHPAEEALPLTNDAPAAGESEKGKDSPENRRPMRSLGNSRQVLIDLFWQRFAPGDRLLLCTDGFYQLAQEAEIAQCLQGKAQDAAERLISLVQDRGNADSASVLLIAARSKEAGSPAIPILASRLFWGVVGVAILAGVVVLGTWLGPLLSPEPTPTSSPTATHTLRASTLPAALRPTPTPLPETVTSTPLPTLTAPPTNTPSSPTATSTATAPVRVFEAAPQVIAPYDDEAIYEGDNNRLVWQWHRQLRADEIFEVRIWKEGAEVPARGAIQTSVMEPRFGVPFGQAGKYFWSVAAARRTLSDVELVSAWSEAHFFWWMGPRPSKPPTPTPVPTPTPLP
jgi:protein phosphatase